ncbi:MAG: zf-HC2 domain-containing protein [Polyangia bacterium]
MSCKKIGKYIDAHLDEELEAGLMLEVEQHLDSCPSCAALERVKRDMKSALARMGRSAKAPDHLREKVLTLSARRSRRRWIYAASAPLAAAASLLLVIGLSGPEPESEPIAAVVDDVVARHAHELPMEVSGPDPSRAASWFRGKVDFSVSAPRLRLTDASFRGARLSNVRANQAAQMAYSIDGHRVSLMIFPVRRLSVDKAESARVGGRPVFFDQRKGFNVAVMVDGDLAYALSSDLPRRRLVSLLAGMGRVTP